MKRALARIRGDRRGQSAIELALLLPVLLLMLAGIVDFGRGMRNHIVITNAAGVGARYGSTHPSDSGGITTRVQTAASGTGVVVTSVVTSYPSGNVRGNPIRVTVTYQFSALLGAILGRNSLTLSSRVEQVII